MIGISADAWYRSLGGLGLFIALFIEAMGIPFPGSALLVFTGLLVARGELAWYAAVGVAVVAYVAGSMVAYLIGYLAQESFFKGLARLLRFNPENLERARSWFDKSAAAFIIGGRFVPWVSNVMPYLAGMSRYNIPLFLLYNGVFSLAWSGFYILAGALFGEYLQGYISLMNGKAVYLGLALIAIYFLYRLLRQRRARLPLG